MGSDRTLLAHARAEICTQPMLFLHHTIIHTTIGFMYFVITIHFAGGYFCCSELQPKVSYCWDLFSPGKRTDFVVNG